MTMDLATAKRLVQQERLRELLGVAANAQGKELRKACRLARARHHPDKGGNHELAVIINAAVDELLRDPSQGATPYIYRTAFVSRPLYTNWLRNTCQLIAKSTKEVAYCIEKCGYGSQLPKCSRIGDCLCAKCCYVALQCMYTTACNRIQGAQEVLQVTSTADTEEELRLIQKLRQELSHASDIAHKCKVRATLFFDLGRRPKPKKPREVEQQEPQTITSEVLGSVVPEQLEQTQPQSSDTGAAAEEYQDNHEEGTGAEMPAETQGQTVATSYFPRASVGLQKREPEKALRLKQLWYEYRKVSNTRRMRVQRGHSATDLDEQLDLLKQIAWHLVQNEQSS